MQRAVTLLSAVKACLTGLGACPSVSQLVAGIVISILIAMNVAMDILSLEIFLGDVSKCPRYIAICV